MKRFVAIVSILSIIFSMTVIPTHAAVGIPETFGIQEAYWKLDEGSGSTAFDESANNYDGTLINSPTYIPGKFGYTGDYALDFDGTSQYINIGTMGTFGSSMSTNTFTFWYNSTNTADQDIVFGEFTGGNSILAIGKNLDENSNYAANKFGVAITDGGTGSNKLIFATTDAITNASDGQWHYVVVTSDLTTGSGAIYFDGVSQPITYLHSGNIFSMNNFGGMHIGHANTFGWYFDGSLDNLAIYNSTLTAGEIYNNYIMGIGGSDVEIYATVDPTISLTLSSNTCNLGNLTTATANTCTYDATTATNAANGLVVKFSADTAYLASGSNNIDACASSGCTGGVNAGTEEYGFYVSTVGSNHDATGYSADSEPLPTTATTVITAADPHTDTTSTITHKAAVSPITPAGAYFHTVTVTAVGSF